MGGNLISTMRGINAPIIYLAWSPNNKVLAATTVTTHSGYLWNIDGSLIVTLKTNSNSFSPLKWSPNGQYFAVNAESNDRVDIYRADGSIFTSINRDATYVRDKVWSPDSKFLAVNASESIKIANIENNSLKVKAFDKTLIEAIGWSGNSKLVIAYSVDNYITILSNDVVSMTSFHIKDEVHSTPRLFTSSANNIIGFSYKSDRSNLSKDNSLLTLYKFDETIFKTIKTINRFERFTGLTRYYYTKNDLAWSPDGKILATTNFEAVNFFDIEGNALATAHTKASDGINEVVWSPNGNFLVVGDEKSYWLLRPDGQILGTFNGDKKQH